MKELELFSAYAMTLGMTLEAVIEFDRWRHPGRPYDGFNIWRNARIAEFMDKEPAAFNGGKLVDQKRFERYCRMFAMCAGVTMGRA